MAGSFRHCDDDGAFQWDLIDNMGDALEACEMMHWIIRSRLTEDQISAAEAEYYQILRGGE